MLRLVRFGLSLGMMLFLTAACGVSQTEALQQDKSAIAIALEQQGRLSEAETAWQEVLRIRPSDADAYAHLGLLEARQEHYKEAVSLYRKALAINSAMRGLRLNLGLSLFKSGELKQAIETLTPLLKSTPPSSQEAPRLSTLIGMAHFGLGEYAAAVPNLRKAAKSDPTNLGLRLVLAHSCLSSKQYQCVLDVYREILNLNAESAEADMLAGEALDEMKNTSGAIEQFRAAVKADPKEPNVHFGLGYLLWKQNQFDEAVQEFQAELGNFPDNSQALTFLADSEIQVGKSSDALPLLEKAIRLDSSIARAHMDLGIIYADSGRKEDALREMQAAVKLTPEDGDVHWRLARLYQAMGKREEAKIEFEKTSRIHKAENDSILTKLKTAQDKGKPAEATIEPPASK